ncbi:MAG: hypothetical protein IIT70_06435 [Clostridia bacterium]|nr:hypothetical protein [Clostridia bacterium]
MTRTLLIILSAFAVLAALSLVPIRIRLRAVTAPLGAELRFGAALFRRPVRLSFTLRAAFLRGRPRLFLVTKRGVTLLKKRKKREKRRPSRLFAALLRACAVPRLAVSGRLGFADDPAASALAAGTLGGIVDSAERIAFAKLPCGLPGDRSIRILPDFSGKKPFFCIDGIVCTDLHKLITSLAKAYLLKEN